ETREVWISPAREAILTPENLERARGRVRAACDAVDLPSAKARALVDDVASGRTFFGSEGLLPAFVDLCPLSSYLPSGAVSVLGEPAAITAAPRDELGRAAADEGQKARAPHFPLATFYEPEQRVAALLRERAVLALHRTGIEGEAGTPDALERFEVAPPDT